MALVKSAAISRLGSALLVAVLIMLVPAPIALAAGPTQAIDYIVIGEDGQTISAGGSATYTATAWSIDGVSWDVTSSTAFTIGNAGWCSGPVCDGWVAGPQIVTGTYSGKSDSVTLHINTGPVDGIALTPHGGVAGTWQVGGTLPVGRYLGHVSVSAVDVSGAAPFTTYTLTSCTPQSGGSLTASDGPHSQQLTLVPIPESGKEEIDFDRLGVALTIVGVAGTSARTLACDLSASSISTGGVSSTVGADEAVIFSAATQDFHRNTIEDVTGSTTFSAAGGLCTANSCSSVVAGDHQVTATYDGHWAYGLIRVPGALDHVTVNPISQVGGTAIVGYGLLRTTPASIANVDVSMADPSTTYTLSEGSASGKLTLANGAGDAQEVTLAPFIGATGVEIVDFDSLGVRITIVGSRTKIAADLATGLAGLTIVTGPADQTIVAHGAAVLSVIGYDATGNSLGDVSELAGWSIGAGGSCTGNVCTAETPGDYTVTATYSERSDTFTLHVTPGTVDHLAVETADPAIAAHGSASYVVTAFAAEGEGEGSDVTSSATLSISGGGSCAAGLCTSDVAGDHVVTATYAGVSATTTLHVSPGALASISLTPQGGTPATTQVGGWLRVGAYLGGDFISAVDVSSASPATSYTLNSQAGARLTLSDGVGSQQVILRPIPDSGREVVSFAWLGVKIEIVGAPGESATDVAADFPLGLPSGPAAILTRDRSFSVATANVPVSFTAQALDPYGNSLGDVTGSTSFSIAGGRCTDNSCTSDVAGSHAVSASYSGYQATGGLQVVPGAIDHLAVRPAPQFSGTATTGSALLTGAPAMIADVDTSAAVPSATYTLSIGGGSGTLMLSDGLGASESATLATIGDSCLEEIDFASLGIKITIVGSSAKSATDLAADLAGLTIVTGPIDRAVTADGPVELTARAFDAYGNDWDATGSATFTIDGAGSCTGRVCKSHSVGDYTVTGSYSGRSGTATLHVHSTLAYLTVGAGDQTVFAHGSATYTAAAHDAFGGSWDVTAFATFGIGGSGSCARNVCTTDAAGDHTITASFSGHTDTATLHVNAAGAVALVMTGPAAVSAGEAHDYTVTAHDAYGNVADGYSGTVTITTDDGQAVLPSPSALDDGVGTFALTFGTAKQVSIGANDGALYASSSQVTVGPASASRLAISAPSSAPAGTPFSITVTALDCYGNTATGYRGTIHLTSSSQDAALPEDYAFGPGDSGVHTFTNGVTLVHVAMGDVTITAGDSVSAGITAMASVRVDPRSLARLVLTPANADIFSGGSQSYTAEGFDSYGNSLGDVTAATTFTIDSGAPCPNKTCTATSAADHTVLGTDGSATGTANLHVTALLPGRPVTVRAAAANLSAVVSWSAPPNDGGSPITGYTVTSSPGGKTCTWSSGPLSCSVTGLTNGQAYTFKVAATNGMGTGLASDPSSAVTPSSPSVGSTYHAVTPARVLDTRPTVKGGNPTNIGLSGPFVAGTVRTFGVAGVHYVGGGSSFAVPAGAVAVTGNLTVIHATAPGVIALGPTMSAGGSTSSITFAIGDIRANNVTIGLAANGTLQGVYRSSTPGASVDVIFDVTSYFTADSSGSTYRATTPGRVLDTRAGSGHIGLAGKFANKTVRTVSIAGVNGIGWSGALVPANAVGITGNLTVTNATSDGYLAVGPTMTAGPATSSLNTRKGQNSANGITAALKSGKLQIVWVGTAGSSADVVFDITGFFTPDGSGMRFYALAPYRVLDSSTNTGLSGAFDSGTARTMLVCGTGGASGVPSGAGGIAGNLTVLPSSKGYAFVAPAISGIPTSSTVNTAAGVGVANGFDVSLDAGGHLALIWMGTAGSRATLAVDITGYWK